MSEVRFVGFLKTLLPPSECKENISKFERLTINKLKAEYGFHV